MTDADTQHDDPETIGAKASQAYESARARAADAVDASRGRAQEAARRTVETIDGNPLGVIVGGLAVGALVAAVIPRSQREKDLLAPVGRRVGATAAAAVAAAKDAGRAELDNLGLSRAAAKGQAKSMFDGLIKVATAAGGAAADAGKEAAKAP